MEFLNSGDYYKRTGNYSTNGLTEEAKSWIANAKWYLGGPPDYDSATKGLASNFYYYERGTKVPTGRPTNWVGKVALMYPSDYGYATSGGTTTSRSTCLAYAMYRWDSSSISDCKNNNWLFVYGNEQWTITPHAGYSDIAFYVRTTGFMDYSYGVSSDRALRPTVFLTSNVKITGVTGTDVDPYILSK